MDKFAQEIHDLAQQYGPRVVGDALQATVISGWSDLILLLVWLVILTIVLAIGIPFTRHLDREYSDGAIAGVVICILAAIAWVACFVSLCDPWVYYHITRPELWIAHRFVA